MDKIDLSKFLYLIPARAGSEGLKNKMMREANGKPLLWYTLEFAKGIAALDSIVVVTDGEPIALLAVSAGIRVIREPSRESSSNIISSMQFALEQLKQEQSLPEEVILLQPTQPLRSRSQLHKLISTYFETRKENPQVDGCFSSIAQTGTGLQFHCNEDNVVQWEHQPGTRQEMKQHRRVSGNFFLYRTESLRCKADSPRSAYENLTWTTATHESFPWVDIDTESDFWLFEKILQDNLWSLDTALR